jgi:hypothetical protein
MSRNYIYANIFFLFIIFTINFIIYLHFNLTINVNSLFFQIIIYFILAILHELLYHNLYNNAICLY